MRTLPANLRTQTNKLTGADCRVLVQITPGGGSTRYLSTEAVTPVAQAYTAELLDAGEIYEVADGISDMRLVVFDSPGNRTAVVMGAAVLVYLWPFGGGAEATDGDLMFSGEVDAPMVGGGQIAFTAASKMRRYDRIVGELVPTPSATLSEVIWPGPDPDIIGTVRPIIYGSMSKALCLAVDAGSISTLAVGIDADATSVELTDSALFPASGDITIDREKITYTSNAGNVLSGLTRPAPITHVFGAVVAESQSTYRYLVADHPVKRITASYVSDGSNQLLRVPSIAATLSGGINASVTTLNLVAGVALPTLGYMTIDSEDILFDSLVSSTGIIVVSGLTRGANGTTAATHSNAAPVAVYQYKPMISDSDGRAYLSFEARPIRRSIGDFTIDINDTIDVIDPGHAHPRDTGNLGITSASVVGHSGLTNTIQPSAIYDGNLLTSLVLDASGFANPNRVSTGTITIGNIGVSQGGTRPTSIRLGVRWRALTGIGSVQISGRTFASEYPGFHFETISVSSWVNVRSMGIIVTSLPTVFSQSLAAQTLVDEIIVEKIDYITIPPAQQPTATGVSRIGEITLSENTVAESVIGKSVYADVQGYHDDGSGTYTGTANALIERPDSVMQHLLVTYAGATASETTGFDSYDGASEILAMRLAHRPRISDIMLSFAEHFRAFVLWSGSRFIFRRRDSYRSEPDIALTDVDVVREDDGRSSMFVSSLGLEGLRTRHNWRAGERWDGGWEFSDTDNNAAAEANFGIREFDLDFPWIRNETFARSGAAFWRSRTSNPNRQSVQITTYLKNHAVEVGDTLSVNSTALNYIISGEVVAVGPRIFGGGSAGLLSITMHEASRFLSGYFADGGVDLVTITPTFFLPSEDTNGAIGAMWQSAQTIYRGGSGLTQFHFTDTALDVGGTVTSNGMTGVAWAHGIGTASHFTQVIPTSDPSGILGEIYTVLGVNSDTIYVSGSYSGTLECAMILDANSVVLVRAVGDISVGGSIVATDATYTPSTLCFAHYDDIAGTIGQKGALYASHDGVDTWTIRRTGGSATESVSYVITGAPTGAIPHAGFSGNQITRLGLAGIPRGLYGSFAGKVASG